MYASIRKYKVAGSFDELSQKTHESLLPQLHKVPGFQSFHVVDFGDGTAASISMYDNQEGARISNEIAHHWVQGVSHIIPHPPEVMSGPVVVMSGKPR